jgi:hypothetical protein
LSVAAAVNDELLALDELALNHRGHGSQMFHWHELRPESPITDTRIAAWRRSAREHGLL